MLSEMDFSRAVLVCRLFLQKLAIPHDCIRDDLLDSNSQRESWYYPHLTEKGIEM